MEGAPLASTSGDIRDYVSQLQAQIEQDRLMALQQNALIQQLQSEMFKAQAAQEQLKNQIVSLTLAPKAEPSTIIDQLPKGFKTPNLDSFSGSKGEDLESWLFQANEQF